MANRYWVGGTASWDATAGTKWATTSGGAGGASVPTSADDVFFDANSGASTVTVAANSNCLSLNFTGFTGTFAGTSGVSINGGNLTIASGMTWTHSGTLSFAANTGAYTITSNGKAITSGINFGSSGISTATWSLGDAFNTSSSITLSSGTFTTNNYNVTASSLSSSNSNTRTINLGSSTVTLSATGTPVAFTTSTNLTFNAGTSQINCVSGTLDGGGKTFYNVSFTGTTAANFGLAGANTYNNITFAGRSTAGITTVIATADQTINGTLTLLAGTDATMRTFVRSDTIGTTRTLTCAAVASLTDIDFRDITIAGAAVFGGNLTGTRLGDCKGNSGITFDAPKTVYFRAAASSNWGIANWSLTSGGAFSANNFPLAQDTAVFPSSPTPYPTSGNTVTINAAYNIGTIDMSARTSNTMTLATSTNTPTIYGNWINGTGTTLTGTGQMTFAGRGSQTITSAGKSFTQNMSFTSPGGSVTLQDAFTGNTVSLTLLAGTLDFNNYSVTASTVSINGTVARTLSLGTGTTTLLSSGGVWTVSGLNSTVTGTGTISLTSSTAKTFAGGGIQTYPTLNQGGTGALTVTGSNKFKGLTNTAIGRIQFTGGTTNIFDSFTISGSLGNLLPLGSTNTTQAILQKSTAWQMGLLSMDSGNNTGLSFLSSDGTMEYLNVSYINGTVVAPPATSTGNFFFFF